MRIMVTGAAGFVGRNFREYVDRQCPEHVFLAYEGNVLHEPGLQIALRQSKADGIVHLAAKVGAQASFRTPTIYADVNINGTSKVVAAAASCGIGLVVHVSTSEVYGTGEDFKESSPLHPESPYAASKATADLVSQSFSDVSPIIVRLSSVFGPWDRAGRMIPRCVEYIRGGQPIKIYGDGSQKRDWIYVDDAVEGILAALKNGRRGEIYNIGNGVHMSASELAQEVATVMGVPKHPLASHLEPSGLLKMNSLNAKKAQESLGWVPQRNLLSEHLKKTVEWLTAKG